MNERMDIHRAGGFTLVELLVVIAIIGVLTSVIVPTIGDALTSARSVQCQTNLRYTGTAIDQYQRDNKDQFPPYRARYTEEYKGTPANTYIYYWGSAENPVNKQASWMYDYWDFHGLLCPSLNWDDLVPQAGVIEPTTAYGYNAQFCDPAFMGRIGPVGTNVPCKTRSAVPKPAQLIVFADSGLHWSPGGVSIFQNSTFLEHPEPPPGWVVTPTNHFRHVDQHNNALCASGSIASSPPNAGGLLNPEQSLGFVGTTNDPHYK